MTTFTTEDRVNATVDLEPLEPIPFAGMVDINKPNMSRQDIADEHGVSRQTVADIEQKALKKDYSAPYDEHAVLKNTYRSDFTVAGGKTPPAKTTNDLPMGTTSPMTKVKRPPRPATGANPKG